MEDLKYLKKHYGEKFSHLCRELFPTLLEQEGLVAKIISNHFAPSRSLYEDILPLQDGFKAYVYSFVDVEQEKIQERVTKTPAELMDEAGYILYPECKTEEDVQSFKKYYAEGEELCTFNGGRLNNCRVWFAVKKNVDQIRREDFKSPKRQDEYGTSVISIQFSIGNKSTLSIKNRYNHRVNNPDATFSNNLDNIIEGLAQSFVETYKIPLVELMKQSFEIPSYRLGDDGKFYKVNVEIEDICYCENNVVLKHGRVFQYDKARYVLAEQYLIDKQKNTIKDLSKEEDSFLKSIGKIKTITTKTDKDGNKVFVFTPTIGEDVELTLNGSNQIIGYCNTNVAIIEDNFLFHNKALSTLFLPNLETIGDNFLYFNSALTTVSLPNAIQIKNAFLSSNKALTTLFLPNVETIGDDFLYENTALRTLSLPEAKRIEGGFLRCNERLTKLSLPKAEKIGKSFLHMNESLVTLSLPNVTTIGDSFLGLNKSLTTLSLPKAGKIGQFFLYMNESLATLSLPNVTTIGDYFLRSNKSLVTLSLPNAVRVKFCGFLDNNKSLEKLYAPYLKNNLPEEFKSVLTKEPIEEDKGKEK